MGAGEPSLTPSLLPAPWPQERALSTLSLSFLICKMVRTTSTLRGLGKMKNAPWHTAGAH